MTDTDGDEPGVALTLLRPISGRSACGRWRRAISRARSGTNHRKNIVLRNPMNLALGTVTVVFKYSISFKTLDESMSSAPGRERCI